MSSVRYYGRKFDEENFHGLAGSFVRGLNRVRSFTERAAEVAVAVHEAKKEDIPLRPILWRMLKEGIAAPVDILTRAPISPEMLQGEDTEFASRFYNSRDYSARVGRTKRQTALDAVRDTSVREDPTLSFFARYGQRNTHRTKHGLPPLLIENFLPVEKENEETT